MRLGRWVVQTRYGGVCCGLAWKRQSTARWRDETRRAGRRPTTMAELVQGL
jgi:hypothetical protein